jgi:hypothetical protein
MFPEREHAIKPNCEKNNMRSVFVGTQPLPATRSPQNGPENRLTPSLAPDT